LLACILLAGMLATGAAVGAAGGYLYDVLD
jgi:hypothetical protein